MTDLPERLRMLSDSLDDVDYPITAKADCLKAARIVELFYKVREREIVSSIEKAARAAGNWWYESKGRELRREMEAETEAMVEGTT